MRYMICGTLAQYARAMSDLPWMASEFRVY